MKTMDALDMMGGMGGSKMAPPESSGKDNPMDMVRDARDMMAGAAKLMDGKKAEHLQMCIDMLDADVLEVETEEQP